MDIMVGISRTSRHHVSIWLIVDKMSKSAHFIPMGIDEIVRWHVICLSIMLYSGS